MVRRATEKDLDFVSRYINELRNRFKQPAKRKDIFKKFYLSCIENETNIILVATNDDEAAGFISLNIRYNLYNLEKTAVIDEFVIEEKLISDGVATEILNKTVKICKKEGIKALEAVFSTDDEGVINFYEGNNFKRIGNHYYKPI